MCDGMVGREDGRTAKRENRGMAGRADMSGGCRDGVAVVGVGMRCTAQGIAERRIKAGRNDDLGTVRAQAGWPVHGVGNFKGRKRWV